MSTTVEAVLVAARQLSPAEQLELIEALSGSLRRQHQSPPDNGTTEEDHIPASIRRTPPVTNLEDLVADFWPEDETADDIAAFVARQRAEDRLREG